METPKVYQPGEGSEVEVPDPVETEVVPTEGIEVVEPTEEGSGDYVEEEKPDNGEADDSYAQHRSENRGT